MAKYVYLAVFKKEENGRYSINFPDLESCYTQGDDLKDGMEMAQDVLALTLYGYEKDGKPIPLASGLSEICVSEDSFVNYIVCDTDEYRRMYHNRAIKKTVTIPEWLNEEALKEKIDFSQVLQDALIQKIEEIKQKV